MKRHHLACCLPCFAAALLTIALLGCGSQNQASQSGQDQDQETRQKVANATATAKEKGQEAAQKLDVATKELQHKAKVAAQGVKEGWERSGAPPSRPLNLNTASAHQLTGLPGLSVDDAQRIVDNRPYKDKHDLVTRKIISTEEYSKLEGRITVE